MASKALGTEVLVTGVELLYSSGSVHDSLLTGVEGVRSIGNFNFHQRIFFAIFKYDGFLGGGGRFAQKTDAITHVFEDNEAIAFRVESFFHVG